MTTEEERKLFWRKKWEEIDIKTEFINFSPSDFMWMILNGNNEQLSAIIYIMFADIQLKADIDYKLEEMENNAALYPYGHLAASKFRYIEILVKMDKNTKDRVRAVKAENKKENNDELQLERPIDPNTQKLEEAMSYEQGLFNQFADFKKHSEFLKKEGYYKLEEGHLCWKHGGNLLLAAYFGTIQERPGNPTCTWANIEKAYNTKNLAQHYYDFKNLNKGKTDKYYEYAKKLSELIDGRIS